MKRLLAARGTSAGVIGLTVALAAGGGYALANSRSGKVIHACVHKRGGDVYIAKKCAKGDKMITWNKTGPPGQQGIQGIQGIRGRTGSPGPGATYLVWDASGTASPTPTRIGTMGPWTVRATCQQAGTQTTISVTITGPGGHTDEFAVNTGGPFTVSQTFGPQTNGSIFGAASLSTTPNEQSGDALMIPTSGRAVDVHETFVVTGGATNTCHFSANATPTSPA